MILKARKGKIQWFRGSFDKIQNTGFLQSAKWRHDAKLFKKAMNRA